MKTKDRIDKIMTDRGLAKSRERAKALIMAGSVVVDGHPISKAGDLININADILIKKDIQYVSRGGLKLEAALDFFKIDPSDKIVMDIGCSTGGFTDCVLQRNAARVYAVDVGYGQIDWTLRQNPRIILLEKTNIRYLERNTIADAMDLIVIDVSFISLTQVLPKAFEFLKPEGIILALIKPQFEVGKSLVEKGGIIRDEEKHISTIEKIKYFAESSGFSGDGIFESPVRGQKGNKEFFITLRRIVNG